MRLGVGGDTLSLREAAGPRDIDLHDIDRAAPDQLAEPVETEFGLVTGYRGMQRIRHAYAALDIVGLDRLFDPVEAIRLHCAAHLDRERRAPGAIDIDHQLSLRPERFAHRRDPLQILARIDLAEPALAEQLAQMGPSRGIAP